MKSEIVTVPGPDNIRVLKTATCPSLSGKSKLTYHVGWDSEIQLRVHANSAKGFFSREWVSLRNVSQALGKIPKDQAITSASFSSLFQGRSVNTPGFLLAALKSEGLVRPSKDKRRCYELCDATDFIAEVQALMGSPAGASATSKPKHIAAAKKPAAGIQKGKAQNA